MKFKDGVILPLDMDARLLVALSTVEQVFKQRPHVGEPVITSMADGEHSSNSYHYKGRAFDIRTKGTGSATWIHHELKIRLAHLGFDVVLEDLGEANEHIHIEIDRRADKRARKEAVKRSPANGPGDGRTEGTEG